MLFSFALSAIEFERAEFASSPPLIRHESATAYAYSEETTKEDTQMSDRQHNQLDSHRETTPAGDATQRLQELALTLYQCKDGSLVNNPLACRQTIGALPNLELTNSNTQLAGNTIRRSDEGWTTDGGKILKS